MLRYAVERPIEVIGEAARHISGPFKMKHPEIPWGRIIGQRNVLAHEYGEILLERVWRTAKESIPELAELLDKISTCSGYTFHPQGEGYMVIKMR
jgi:uncharacterized protein with HEPN domain